MWIRLVAMLTGAILLAGCAKSTATGAPAGRTAGRHPPHDRISVATRHEATRPDTGAAM